MPAEKKLSIRILRGTAAKRNSSALATTASTCQIPGGTSLLVGCVLGKNTAAHQLARCSLEQRISEERVDLEVPLSSDNEPASDGPDGKESAKILAVPRSMSINSPSISNASHLPVYEKFSGMNITLLFDKVVSATDCRSTGHFVLPKRKVEEHFPPLSKPGGVWMSLVDDAGKEWTFEFCFWYSKESRIYYFKKFYPYVQARRLRGGDTVYFSRLEPDGTLLMGIRKQEPASPKHSKSAKPNASKDELGARALSDSDHKVSTKEGNSVLDEAALLEDFPSTPSTETTNVDYGSNRTTDERKWRRLSPRLPLALETKSIDCLASEKTVLRNNLRSRQSVTPESFEHVNTKPGSLGSGGKRLGLTMEDYCEWEDIQDLFRAPPGAIVTTTYVDGLEVEEYKDPPVLIKKAFYSPEIPEDDQLVKCDDCGCWRRLPADAFVPASWICSDNEWDLRRAHCSAPQELSDLEMDELLGALKEAEIETTETESYDNDSELLDSPRTEEEDAYCKKPRTWSEAYGQMQKHAYQLVLSEKCKSYTTAKSVREDMLGSSELNSLSGRSSGRRLPQVHVKVGKGHQMCTGCSKFIGSAAQACKQCGTLTEYGARRRGQSSSGYK